MAPPFWAVFLRGTEMVLRLMTFVAQPSRLCFLASGDTGETPVLPHFDGLYHQIHRFTAGSAVRSVSTDCGR